MVTTTKYLYHGSQYVGEADENGALTRRYVNEPEQYTHLIGQHEFSSGSSRTYHYDAVGSTREVTDDTEAVTDEFTYDAWGNRLSRIGTSEMAFQYVGAHGYFFDEETSSYYIRERVYQPTVARWQSKDPSGLIDSMNLYSYVTNNAVNYIDPSGLKELSYLKAFTRGLEAKFKVFIVDQGFDESTWTQTVCVHVHIRRYLEQFLLSGRVKTKQASIDMYRERWNRYLNQPGTFVFPGREIWSEKPDKWIFPNLSLILNGCDANNHYGGSYTVGARFFKDDDYMELSVSSIGSDGKSCDEDKTKCWHTVGAPAQANADPEKAVYHVAGSSEVCVELCGCDDVTKEIVIKLDYMDARWGGNYGDIIVPYHNGVMGEPTVKK